jgi:hypothetical protein
VVEGGVPSAKADRTNVRDKINPVKRATEANLTLIGEMAFIVSR